MPGRINLKPRGAGARRCAGNLCALSPQRESV